MIIRARIPRLFRRSMGAALLILLLAFAGVAGAASHYPAGPSGPVGVSQPTIGQKFILDPGESILGAQMWLDGSRVLPVWDKSGQISYRPSAPLAPGKHTVRLSVDVAPANPGFYYDPIVSNFSFTVADDAVDTLPGPGVEEDRALVQVNRYRRAAGLAPLRYSNPLGAAAQGHARYLAANPAQVESDPHGETAGTPLYFGRDVLTRAQYYGYQGSTAEVVNYTDRAEAAVDGWMETPYHRIPLMQPGNQEMGYGLAAGTGRTINVIDAGPLDETVTGVALWPFPGQTDVPVAWDGEEHPDPLGLYPGATKPVGYTISMTFGGSVQRLTLNTGTLTGPSGTVPVMSFYPGFDPHLTDTVALIPRSPLTPGATYTVHLAGSVDLGRGPMGYDRTWSFTTRPERVPMLTDRVAYTEGGVLTSVEADGSGFEPGIRLFLGGLPVEGLQVEPRRLLFSPPVGYDGTNTDLLAVTSSGQEHAVRDFLGSQGRYQAPPATDPFTPVPLLVNGRQSALPALRHSSGTLLVPGEALQELGGRAGSVSEIGRTYWQLGGLAGDYTLGHTAATVGDADLNLALPVQYRNGALYVDSAFVRGMIGGAYTAWGGRVFVGMADTASHWASGPIFRLLQAGIVAGTGDGYFRPNDSLTRAAFVKMLVKARSIAVRPGDDGGLADTAGHWVASQGFIGAAVQAGIVAPDEYPGLRFEPDRPISREEMAVMVARALGLGDAAAHRSLTLDGGVAEIAGKSFADAASWSRPGFIAVAIEQSIITGYQEADGRYTYRPAQQATRAEATVMVGRMLDWSN